MQTFVPTTTGYADIAKTLDRQRLNKQALEGWQIMMTLLELDPQGNHRVPKGWVNHPAVRMWRGYEYQLCEYVQSMVTEWKSRGYKSTIGDKAEQTRQQAIALGLIDPRSAVAPGWLTDKQLSEAVASSHRVALLNKDYEWYSQFDWAEDTGRRPDTYDYVWPVA
jgi:hypothetical protein